MTHRNIYKKKIAISNVLGFQSAINGHLNDRKRVLFDDAQMVLDTYGLLSGGFTSKKKILLLLLFLITSIVLLANKGVVNPNKDKQFSNDYPVRFTPNEKKHSFNDETKAKTHTCPTISATISGTANQCFGASSNLIVTISGGVSPYNVVYSGVVVNNYISGSAIVVAPTSTTTYILTSVTDANGCTATVSGSFVVNVLNRPGMFGNALQFDGVNDYIETSADITNLNNANFTIEAWIRTTSSAGLGIAGLMNNNTSWEPGEKMFYVAKDGTPVYVGWGNNYIYSTKKVNDGAWHHVAVVWSYSGSGTSGSGTIYVDGLNQTSASSNHAANYPNVGTFKIGFPNYGTEAPAFFSGFIDEIRVWNTARTLTQIQANLNIEIAGNESGLLAYYDFNSGIVAGSNTGVTTLTNKSSNNYHGVLTNFALTGAGSNWVGGNNFTIPAITGTTTFCVADSFQLSNSVLGGAWSTSNAAIVSINNAGMIKGIAGGNAAIAYTLMSANGCTIAMGSNIVVDGNLLTLVTAQSTAQQAVCTNLSINPIQYSFTGNPSVSFSGLPVGTNGSSISNTVNISGNPSVSGSYPYRVALSSGCFRTGTIMVKNLPNQFGNALNFDGTNDYVETGGNITNFNNASFTIEAWIKTSSNNSMGIVGLLNNNTSWDGGEKLLYVSSNGTPAFVGFGNGYILSTQKVNDGNWHHIAVVWKYSGSGNSGTAKFYVDGLDKTSPSTSISANFPNVGTVKIGYPNYNSEASSFFNGTIDEVRIWNVDRSIAQIQTFMNTELSGNETGLAAYYDFNTGTAGGNNADIATIANMVSSSHTGSLINFSLSGNSSNWVSGNSAQIPQITGSTSICLNSTTLLSNSLLGGVWSSSNPATATINSSGTVASVATGSTTIVYQLTSGFGCQSAAQSVLVVNPNKTILRTSSIASISQQLCVNSTLTTIGYQISGATGANFTNLPTGVSGNINGNTITINGAPTVVGTSNYRIDLTGGCGTSSSSGTITVTPSGEWRGTSNNNWSEPANWCGQTIPSQTNDVIIPAGLTNYPTINGTSPVKNLTIASGASLTVTGLLQVSGSINNSGTLDLSAATLELNGSTAQSIPSGSFVGKTVKNLIVNNSAGVDLGDSLKITGTLTPTLGTLTTNGKLVIRSTATGTARIAAGTGNYLNGAVIVERYISPKTARKYSFVAATTNQSIRTGWQNQIYITGAGTGGTPCGAGTGNGGTTDRYNSNGFDKTQTNTPSMYTYNVTPGSNGSRWVTIANTTNINLEVGKGYRLNIRGDRNVGTCTDQLNSNIPTAPVAVTLQTIGTVSIGNVTITLNNPATHLYTLLGNPYPSQISLTSLFAGNNSNISNKMWTYSPYGNGNYTTYSNGLIANAATGYDNTNGDFIASGQAFFVEAKTTGSGTVTFQEAHKTAGTIPNTQYFGTANQQLIRIGLKTSGDSSLDEAVVRFNGSGNKNYLADWDAISFGGGAQNVAIQKGSSRLAIATLPVSTTTDSILLTVKSSANGSFKLNFSDLEGLDSNKTYWLRDVYLNQNQNIRSISSYAFNITADSLSKGDNRFLLIAKAAGTTLPVRFVALTAKATDRREAVVTWAVAVAKDVNAYVVERSTNGVAFAPIATVKATNANQYSIMDAQLPENGEVVYYRILAIASNGEKAYSRVVQLTTNPSSLINISPNPAKGAFAVQLPSVATQQRYIVTIYSVDGKAVRTEQNLTPTEANTLRLTTNGLTSGAYQLKVQGENGAVWIVRLQVGD